MHPVFAKIYIKDKDIYTNEEKTMIDKESSDKTETSTNLARKYKTSYGNTIKGGKPI